MGYRAIIREIRIKNFRSIVEATIPLDNFNIFVGLNDCGKSNVLKALNLFFNGETEAGHSLDFKRDYCQHGRTGKGKAKEIVIEVSIQVPEEFSEAGIKKWKKVWRDNKLHEDNFTTLFRQYSKCATLFSRIHFEYIPAVKSDVFFQELLLKLYYSMVASADGKLAKVNQDYSKALAELTVNLHESVKSQIGLDSKIKMPDQMSALFRNLKISTSDSNIKNIDINHRGDGIKARHIPSILVTIAHNIKESRKKNSVDHTFIWRYEEPENGVEFFSCSKLADEIYSYSSNIQIFITTHSPAIYSKNDAENVKCYYTYKSESGDSKYDSNRSVVELNDNIGLMPLIAPYIQKFQNEIKDHNERIHGLQNEIERLKRLTQKVVIYTEGKTDIKYLKLAFSKFPEYADIQSRVDYYDIEHANKTGDGELQTICEYLQKGNDPNIKICMFDRDNPQMIRNEEYSAYANNTYRFNIPIPSHRSEDDRIAIEHYLSDEDLSTIDSDGKKLFLAKEFDDVGRSLDGQFFRQHAKRHDHEKYDPLEILNGSEDKRVYSIHQNDSKNYALTKDQFVAHIENQDNGFDFDFSAYRLILGIIEKIVAEADRKNLGQ